jgi:transposase InsO family protein
LGEARRNAFPECVVQTRQLEVLEQFVVLGEQHLNQIVREFAADYHELRLHQALGNLPPLRAKQPEAVEGARLYATNGRLAS